MNIIPSLPTSAAVTPSCPCRSPTDARPIDACCGRYHAGPLHLQAPDAEALMRSRYSAFALDRLAYLLATWHASTRPEAIEANPPKLKWLGLEVRRHDPIDADHATVEFVARHLQSGRAERLHETSRFVREKGGGSTSTASCANGAAPHRLMPKRTLAARWPTSAGE